jgi:hypothetical protein
MKPKTQFNNGFTSETNLNNANENARQIIIATLNKLQGIQTDFHLIEYREFRLPGIAKKGFVCRLDLRNYFQQLVESAEKGKLTKGLFISTISTIFDEATFRLEPCIRTCSTQLWKLRFFYAHDTATLIKSFSEFVEVDLSPDQSKLFNQLKSNLFSYYDAMGAYLFEEKIDYARLDEYVQEGIFPKEKKIDFYEESVEEGEKISDRKVTSINQPLRAAIKVVNDLNTTIKPDSNFSDLKRCTNCFCEP